MDGRKQYRAIKNYLLITSHFEPHFFFREFFADFINHLRIKLIRFKCSELQNFIAFLKVQIRC